MAAVRGTQARRLAPFTAIPSPSSANFLFLVSPKCLGCCCLSQLVFLERYRATILHVVVPSGDDSVEFSRNLSSRFFVPDRYLEDNCLPHGQPPLLQISISINLRSEVEFNSAVSFAPFPAFFSAPVPCFPVKHPRIRLFIVAEFAVPSPPKHAPTTSSPGSSCLLCWPPAMTSRRYLRKPRLLFFVCFF